MVEDARKYSQIYCLVSNDSQYAVVGAYSEPSVAILGNNLLLVAHPISVPSPEGCRVVDADGINALDLKPCTLEARDIESKRGRGISTREDILVHEKTPNEILILPRFSQSSKLENGHSVIIQHIIALSQKGGEVPHADVLSHLEASDLVISSFWNRNIAIVHAKNIALFLRNTGLTESVVAPCCLVAAKSDTSNMGSKVNTSELGKGAPPTANVQHLLTWLEINLLANNRELVVLQLLEGLLLCGIRNYTRRVHHAWTKEPAVEIITSIIMVANLLLVYNVR